MPQGELIRDWQLVAALLRRLVEQRALLSVSLPGFPGSYNSAILRLEPAQDFVILDELNPRKGHERLLETGRLQVSAQVHGVEIRFSAEVREFADSDGIAYYRLPFPRELLYLQRRQSFRVRVGMATPMTAVFELTGGRTVRARVLDVCEGGLGVEIAQHSTLRPGDTLTCRLRLPDGQRLTCKLEVRHVLQPGDQNLARVGARFLEITPQRRKILARLVADLQRTLIRKQPRG